MPAPPSRWSSSMKRMIDSGALQTRLWVMLRVGDDSAPATGSGGREDSRVWRSSPDGPCPQVDDGRGAWIAWRVAPRAIRGSARQRRAAAIARGAQTNIAELAVQHGYQMAVHAIGDRANREVLDAYEGVFKASGAERRRSALAHRARPTPVAGRRATVRPAWRDCVDAERARDVGRCFRACTAGRSTSGGRRLRLAPAD